MVMVCGGGILPLIQGAVADVTSKGEQAKSQLIAAAIAQFGEYGGIVTPAGLMNPNHYLAVAINYLFQHRPQWGYFCISFQ